jgi:hypothetical protein
MESNPFIKFRHALVNNRWLRLERSTTVPIPTNWKMLRTSVVWILIISVVGLPSIYELKYVGFSADPLAFAVAILFLTFAVSSFCALVVGMTLTTKKKRAIKRSIQLK